MAVFQSELISEEAAKVIEEHVQCIEGIMRKEAERLQHELDPERAKHVYFAGLPDELRWRIMVLGCSAEDYNLWIRRNDQDGGQWYELTEVETGCGVGGVTPREACENYFRDDVLDRRG